MSRVCQSIILMSLGAALFAIGAKPAFGLFHPAEDSAKISQEAAVAKEAGVKTLVAFDPYSGKRSESKSRRAEFDKALKKANVKVVSRHHFDNYLLLDCGALEPAKVLSNVPHHAGAIVFRDGKPESIIPSHKGKRKPMKHATLRWGSSATGMKQMNAAVKKYSSMPGVVAKKVNLFPGKRVFGNPFVLRMTPSEGKTLLEIFLLAEAQFEYTDVKAK